MPPVTSPSPSTRPCRLRRTRRRRMPWWRPWVRGATAPVLPTGHRRAARPRSTAARAAVWTTTPSITAGRCARGARPPPARRPPVTEPPATSPAARASRSAWPPGCACPPGAVAPAAIARRSRAARPDAASSGTHLCNYDCPAKTQACTAGGATACIAAGGCCRDSDCPGTCQACSTGHTCVAATGRDDPNGRCPGTCDAAGESARASAARPAPPPAAGASPARRQPRRLLLRSGLHLPLLPGLRPAGRARHLLPGGERPTPRPAPWVRGRGHQLRRLMRRQGGWQLRLSLERVRHTQLPGRRAGNATFTPAGACDGNGQCTAGTPRACSGGLTCASASACKTSCGGNGDCVAGIDPARSGPAPRRRPPASPAAPPPSAPTAPASTVSAAAPPAAWPPRAAWAARPRPWMPNGTCAPRIGSPTVACPALSPPPA